MSLSFESGSNRILIMAELSPGDDPDFRQLLLDLADRADRMEEELTQVRQWISELEERVKEIEDIQGLR